MTDTEKKLAKIRAYAPSAPYSDKCFMQSNAHDDIRILTRHTNLLEAGRAPESIVKLMRVRR